MTVPAVMTVGLSWLHQPADDWHYADADLDQKLAASLRLHGQVLPLVAREREGGDGMEIVDGRKRLRVMQQIGMEKAQVVSLGQVTADAAVRIGLSLGLCAEVDYARLALLVARLAQAAEEPDAFPTRLAAATPLAADRVRYLLQLVHWDWSQYAEVPDAQPGLGFDELMLETPAMPREPAWQAQGATQPPPLAPAPAAAPAWPTEAPAAPVLQPPAAWPEQEMLRQPNALLLEDALPGKTPPKKRRKSDATELQMGLLWEG